LAAEAVLPAISFRDGEESTTAHKVQEEICCRKCFSPFPCLQIPSRLKKRTGSQMRNPSENQALADGNTWNKLVRRASRQKVDCHRKTKRKAPRLTAECRRRPLFPVESAISVSHRPTKMDLQ
jgi:hypothetical protein